MRTNYLTPVLVLLSLVSQSAAHCSPDAPDNCSFDNDNTCNWTLHNPGNSAVNNYFGNFALLLKNSDNFESRPACFTPPPHCLAFDLDVSFGNGGTVDLYVVFTSWTNITANTEIYREHCNLNNNPSWARYSVRLENSSPTDTFTVKFEVFTTQNANVRLDNITYSRAPCSSNGTSTTTTPTNSVTSTQTATTEFTSSKSNTPSTFTTTARPSSTKDASSSATTAEDSVTSSSAKDSTAVVTTAENRGAPSFTTSTPTESSKVGLIVGVVVAIIILLVIGIVVFVVVTRRRGMDFWKTCFSKKKANKTDNITMDSVPSAAVLNMNGQSSNAGRGYENTSLQRDDYYNVIGDADAASPPRDPSSEYAKVNKPPKKTTTANRTSYENTDDIPSNLAPGFEYNHLDFGKRPGTKAGVKPTAAANYSHIHTPREAHTDGAYSLARNPEGQNSASVNDATYQEPLKPAGVYHVLDRDQEEGRNSLNTDSANTDSANTYSANADSVNTAGIYHVPDDGGVETGNYANENSSSNVYHDPYDSSIPRQYQNDANRYGNVEEGASADVPNIPSSSNVYHSIEERPENRPAKPQPPRKPVGIYELAKDTAAAAKKPTSPPKPNTAPHRPPPNTGTSVYHVLESPKSGMGDNYDLAGPVGDSLPSTSVYQLAEPTLNTSHIQPSLSNDGDYNALDFNARSAPQNAEYVDTDPRAVYNHLNEGDGTYNETNTKPEVINDEYSHLS